MGCFKFFGLGPYIPPVDVNNETKDQNDCIHFFKILCNNICEKIPSFKIDLLEICDPDSPFFKTISEDGNAVNVRGRQLAPLLVMMAVAAKSNVIALAADGWKNFSLNC